MDELSRELDVTFNALPEWEGWRDNHLGYGGQAYRDAIVDHILKYGAREPISGIMIPPSDIVRGRDLREGLSVRGFNSRQRAVLQVIEQILDVGAWHRLRIYAPEALTPLALRLRGFFPKFLGSEFTLDPVRRAEMYPIPFQDLTALTLPSGVFDLVTTNEVLEHVPDVDKSLSELARILKPGGWHVGTHPLVHRENSTVKTRLEGGELVHLMPPEYHGDPFGDGGSLVFEIPGWDILARALAAGFRSAHFRLIVSQRHGCIASEGVGIFVLCCQK